MKTYNTIFHNLPGSGMLNIPSPAFSVLKSYLGNNDYSAEVKYWDISFSHYLKNEQQKIASRIEKKGEFLLLFPFLVYLAQKFQSSSSYKKILHYLRISYPEMIIKDSSFYSSQLKQQMDYIIKTFKKENPKENVLLHGFSARFNQWIPSLVLADIIKAENPKQPIVIGGFDSEDEAVSFMGTSNNFDFAIWGEGEIPLLSLCNGLKNNTHEFNKIPRLVYRKEESELISTKNESGSCGYTELDNLSPDFKDYFKYAKKYGIKQEDIVFPIEDARGCRWNKCKFCFLNINYNFRAKSNEKIVSEIVETSKKYGIYSFLFVSTDIAGLQIKGFEDLLDRMLQALSHDNEYIFSCELIPKNIPMSIIKKMAMLNFAVQIGYESTSDSLLAKMNKITRFADLIFFIKFAQKYGLRVHGANIITNILGETADDVMEAAGNLPFLRFFLGEKGFFHERAHLNIKKGSVFYNSLSDDEKLSWSKDVFFDIIPEQMKNNIKNRFSLFRFSSDCIRNNDLWEDFFSLSAYYEKNRYYYNTVEGEKYISYKEYCNEELVKSITFDDPLYIDILKETNEKIESVTSLSAILSRKYKKLKKKELLTCLKLLKEEKLLYYNDNIEKSIISIVKL